MNRKHTGLLPLILVLVIGICAQGIVAAQQPVPTPEPGAVLNPPTLEPSVLATAQANEQAWQAEFESRSPFDFYIAYLIAPDAALGSELMSEQSFIDTFGAKVFHSWNAFAEQNELTPFQIVMIHGSAYDFLDLDWTRWAYRNQVILVGVGTSFEHYIEITGDRCVKDPNPSLADRAQLQIMTFTYSWIYKDESRRTQIDPADLASCENRVQPVDSSLASVMHGRGSFLLDGPEWLNVLVGQLMGDSIYYQLVGTTPRSAPAE